MAEYRLAGGRFAVVVVGHGVYQQAGGGAVPHRHAAHIAAALGRGLNLNARPAVGQVAIPNLHILDAAAHLAAQADAVPGGAATIEHINMSAGAADFVALRIFAGLDGHSVAAGGKLAGKQRAVGAGVRVPAVAVPHALGYKAAVVGSDVVAVDHVLVPAGTVFQRQAVYPHIAAVAHVDQPRPHPAGDGPLVLALGHQGGVLGQVVLQVLLLVGDDLLSQFAAAAGNGALAADDHVFAVRPGGVVQRAQVQKA